jgi:branched-chain amino acid transport system substrate-binding protein
MLVVAGFAGCAGDAGESGGADSAKTSDGAESADPEGEDGGANAADYVAAETLKIGVCDSVTGPAAPYGEPGSRGPEVAAKQVNDEGGIKIGDKTYMIELVTYDNKSDAGEAVAALQKLTDIDGVQFILGWSSSTAAMAVVQAIQNKEVSMVLGNARAPEILLQATGNAWRSATVNCYYPVEDCKYMQANGTKKVAFLAHMNDSTYSVHIDLMTEVFKELGVEVVASENVNAGDRDMLTQMTTIKNSGADTLFTATNVEESALALRQLRELGSDIPMYTFSGGNGSQWLEVCTTEQLAGCYGIRPQAADLGSENDAEARAFFDAFQGVFDEIPPQTSTYTYDNFWILMAAMQKAGTTDWAKVNDAFAELTPEDLDSRVIMNYEPVDGKLFDHRGQAYAPASVLKWDVDANDWMFEATIGSGGAEYVNQYLDDYAKEKGIEVVNK